MTGCIDDFESFTPCQNRNVRIADNSYTQVSGVGTVCLRALTSNGKTRSIFLQNVLLVPSFGQTRLFSWEKAREKGYELFSKGDNTFIRDGNGHEILWAIARNKSLVVQLEENKGRFSSYRELHQALGHPGVTIIKNPSKLYANGNNLPPIPQNFHCSVCEKAKSKHIVPDPIHENPISVFDIIHSDLSGKFSVPSLGGKNYYITFIDGKTRFSWVKFLRNKDDASQAIIDFAKLVHRQFDTKIKRWRTDNGGEFVNKTVNSFFKSEGILHELTPPYEHERNGVAERFNQTL
ncbi:hypothetical protein K3495_g16270, partial [Podosphaera aphanis]